VIDPMLEGTPEPPLKALAEELGVSAKEASNCLVTMRRAFQRLLKEELKQDGVSARDLDTEIRELFRCAQKP
jgi:hypothetical protein